MADSRALSRGVDAYDHLTIPLQKQRNKGATTQMRDINDLTPAPATEIEILRAGLSEIAGLAPGPHLADPCYEARRAIKDYAKRVMDAAEAVVDE